MERSTGSSKERPTRRATDLPVTTSNRNREAAPQFGAERFCDSVLAMAKEPFLHHRLTSVPTWLVQFR